jgi:hypothetical protein
MHAVKKAKYLEDFKLILTFDDQTDKIVDLFPHLYGEIFEPLNDISYFKRFKVNKDTDTIEWENGADMSPDFLYRIGKEIKQSVENKRIKRPRSRKPISKVKNRQSNV